MKPITRIGVAALSVALLAAPAGAADSDELLRALEERIEAMERKHEEEMRALRTEIERLRDANAATTTVVEGQTSGPAGDSGQATEESSMPPSEVAGGGSSGSSLMNALNPAITVFGNFTGRIDTDTVTNDEGDNVDDRFNLREVGIDFRAAIDPWADGTVVVALESESPGEYEVTVEEGYATLKALPGLESVPLGLRLSAGRFRPEFGRMNQIHTHDLPQTTRPRSLKTFLGEEGFVENGIKAEAYIPTPGESNSLAASLAVLNGGSIAVGEDNDGEDMAYLGHLEWFWDLGRGHDLEIGSSIYSGKADEAGDLDTRLYGGDVTYSWKPYRQGRFRSFLLGAELYVADNEEVGGGDSNPLGYYVWSQYQLDRNNYLGVRYDFTEQLDDEDAETDSYAAFWTHYTTEFLRLRVGYEYSESDVPELDELGTAWFELNFVFGSHPVEPYWVNR
jgi:hypothetical protein